MSKLRDAAKSLIEEIRDAKLNGSISEAVAYRFHTILARALAIPDAPAVDWIDVKERLLLGDDGRQILACEGHNPANQVSFEGDGFYYWIAGTKMRMNHVTHWAELPKGPETAKGG